LGGRTDVTPAHDAGSEAAGKAYAAFNGNPALINEARELLTHRADLNDLTVRELERALLNAPRADDQSGAAPRASPPKRNRRRS